MSDQGSTDEPISEPISEPVEAGEGTTSNASPPLPTGVRDLFSPNPLRRQEFPFPTAWRRVRRSALDPPRLARLASAREGAGWAGRRVGWGTAPPPGRGGTPPDARPPPRPMLADWFAVTGTEAAGVLLSVVLVYGGILALTRLVGLRSFSKMSAADFAMTVAIGSALASAVLAPSPSVGVALVGLTGLYAMQWGLARVRVFWKPVGSLLDNEPVLLMAGPEVLEANLRATGVTREDLHGKLREANVFNFAQVIAVVFEPTGDVSVLHRSEPSEPVDAAIFEGVRDAGRIGAV